MKKIFKKLWQIIKTNKKTILRGLIIIGVIAVIGVSVYFILRACGYTDISQYIALRDELGDSFWLWFIIGCLQVLQVIFIPISNQIITIPCAVVFNNDLWKVWLTAWISIWLATQGLYWLGRLGGTKILRWLLNDEDKVNKCKKFLSKSWIFYPIGMLTFLPDDILTTLAGASKMNYPFIAICSLITRGIDTACSVFLYGTLTKTWWGIIILVFLIILVWAIGILFWRYQAKKEKIEAKN